MKYYLLPVFSIMLCSEAAFSKIYHCKKPDGSTSYQEQPCESETVKTLGNNRARKVSEKQMLIALSKLTGKPIEQLNTPEYREAAEALVVTDVSKAYAYTLLHEAPLKYCDGSVRSSMAGYKVAARDAILLGKHYYSNGINLKVGGKQFSHSGEELTSSLNKMISEKNRQYAAMNSSQKKRLCSETKQALDLLTKTYENK